MGVQNNQDMSKVETQPLTDEVKVKITSGDAKIELDAKPPFTGLTKEELMVYAKDPYWIKIRWALFILFWVIWLAMLVASVLIIIQAPKCPSPEPRQWYMKGPIYQVNVGDFKDSDKDGKGDLKGVEDSLEYLLNTEVNSIWLTGFTESKGVNPDYGTIEDFDSLVATAQNRGLKVIVDVGEGGDQVEEAKFWLAHNADGLNMRTTDENILAEVRTLLDEHNDKDVVSPRILLTDLTENFARNQFNELLGKNISDNNVSPLVHFPVKTDLLQSLSTPLEAAAIMNVINPTQWPNNAWPNYALGGKAVERVASRVGVDMADGMNMLLFLLPGTPFTYFGEEVAMTGSGMMDWTTNGTVKDKVTHYSIYQKLALLRHQESILFGETNAFSAVDGKVFGLTRVKRGNPGYLLAMNLQEEDVEVDFSKVKNMPDSVRVAIQSIGLEGVAEEEKAGSFPSNAVPLKAKQSIVFTFVPNFENEGA